MTEREMNKTLEYIEAMGFSNETILTLAIQKAIDGGWKPQYEHPINPNVAHLLEWGHISVNDVIFNHDFAKALWGEGTRDMANSMIPGRWLTLGWKVHLSAMVLAEDPFKYLEEHTP